MDDPGRTGGYLALFSEIGFIILITVLAGILIGYWVDERLRTLPVFVLVGFAVGGLTGAVGVYRLIARFLDRFG